MTAYSEKEILVEAIKLVDEYGELTTTELVEYLRNQMKPSGHDASPLSGRNDDVFSQKVRNLKSHKTLEQFVDVISIKRNTKYISRKFRDEVINVSEEIKNHKIQERKEKINKFRARKVEFDKINRENMEIGLLGEKLVFNFERKYLEKNNLSTLDYLEHTSLEKGDGAGYDILSYDNTNNIKYIEVKTTKGKLETPFFMSVSEYEFMQVHLDNYFLARVYNFNKEKLTGDIIYFRGYEIEATFEFYTSQYKVVFK